MPSNCSSIPCLSAPFLVIKAPTTVYLTQQAAKKYLDVDQFQREGIQLQFFNFPYYVYPQLWDNFISNLSALDLLLNCGPKARDILHCR